MDNQVLYPGGTIGVIGDSTDGPMIVSAARQAGFKVGAYGSDETSEMLQLADFKIVGELSDRERLSDFAERCDLVTYDSQHLSPDVLTAIAEKTALPQGSDFQMMMQDRLLERAFYEQLNVNIPPYATIVSLDDVYQSINSIGYPSVLKPIQKDLVHGEELTIRTQTDIAKAAGLMDWGTYILESTVDYSRELAVTVARNASGESRLFPAVELKRQNGQLTWAYLPATLDDDVQGELDRICHEIVANVSYVGVFEVDFMLNDNGSIYVKQIIPTFGEAGRIFDRATTVSQFEQHIRAIAGMPLSDVQILKPTVMAAFTHQQANAIKTQWTLKPNWHFSFYRHGHQDIDNQQLAGHILVQGDELSKVLEQLEDTEIWTPKSETESE
ncbi:phosphoribosylaminoimidazole carboxylase, ATPase subunit [Secundilactobacillus odoratitofui DSM 19909 = JCM 15043]|uniref:Phosphoribosylaminoimidazole carboxylase, ATPase subunit n=1 Tax=Secundilactobacillus odoratitofui DSM 19909 = JCM 15043 TaxID=1423776 RepID=A0A0R1LW46_9LACO|nr:ATP-grasp domain-containing protein [Secundilactobacillus odoratitofui]KRK97185.1 phosphoribosylaminoimidazole carboxylase, ATPase subunit [Secundilactobacillus odoratitofui DSM 19909 = JCM 15043]